METNFSELEAHLKDVFGNLFQRKSFESRAAHIGEILRANVEQVRSKKSYYDYEQSYQLEHAIRTTDVAYRATRNKVFIGFGGIDDLNYMTRRGGQRAVFFDGTDYQKEVRLKPEPSLPSWIIAEFGRSAGEGVSASGIPDEFKVPYKTRDSKPYLFGPSDSLHYRKKIFFMVTRSKLKRSFTSEHIEYRKHPGIKAGRIFSKGLESAIPAIRATFANAILDSLQEVGDVL